MEKICLLYATVSPHKTEGIYTETLPLCSTLKFPGMHENNKQISDFSIINPRDLLILTVFWFTTLHFSKLICKKDHSLLLYWKLFCVVDG